jgi:hypothetical protein
MQSANFKMQNEGELARGCGLFLRVGVNRCGVTDCWDETLQPLTGLGDFCPFNPG